MRKFVFPLGGAAVLLGIVAVACGTDVVGGSFPPADAGGQDAAKDSASPPPNPDAGTNPDAGDPKPNVSSYQIRGTVVGLAGTGLVLQNNGGDDLTVNANGQFVFATKVEAGKSFNVTIKTQPTAPSQVCSVSGASGTVVAANVTTVVVNCATNKFVIEGSVSGLAGTGLVIQNNNGDDATIGADGSFAFATPLDDGAAYAVTVKTQPSNLSQTCTVTNGSGNVAGANVTGVTITCVTNKYTVGGSVVGLSGSGLVLQNKAGDDLPVDTNGTFKFATSHDDGSGFEVSVKTQPGNPQQNCVVSGGTGTIAGGNVSSVVVNCATDKFVISGTVSGLDGSGLVLQNNGGDDVPVNADGSFAFKTALDDLAAYSVAVLTQPTNKWQTCTVANGSGNVAAGNVSNIAITCTTNGYKVKGSVTGLDGSGLVVQNNGADDLSIAGNGPFEFVTAVPSGSGYLVSTLTNPTNKSQTCSVTSGNGTIGGADVEDVAITCVTNHYSVGGTVTGLAAGNDVVLQNNGGDNLTVGADGTFTFDGELESGQTFAVSVLTQPSAPNQTCVVTGGSGTVTAGNVVSVSVNCSTNSYTAGGTVTGLEGTGLILTNNGVSDLPMNANGTFAFPAQLDGSAYNVAVKTQPTGKSQTCSVTNGAGNLAGDNVTNVSVNCVTNTYTVGGAITGLSGEGVVLTNNGGDDLPVAANGNFQFATPIASGAAYAVAVKTQPTGRTCTVTNGAGLVASTAVTNVTISCAWTAGCKSHGNLLWCRDTASARSCNAFCSALGFGNPTVSNTDWFAAQDSVPECTAIASSFGIGSVDVNSYGYACAEQADNLMGCSTDSNCPQSHRTGSDSASTIRAICPCVYSNACGTGGEGGSATVTCPNGTKIKSIDYASYGTPNGSCGSFTNSSCHAASSQSVVAAACVGKTTCTVSATNNTFGDPCVGTGKRLYIQATCE